jgi:hypothetical protein
LSKATLEISRTCRFWVIGTIMSPRRPALGDPRFDEDEKKMRTTKETTSNPTKEKQTNCEFQEQTSITVAR